MLASEQGTRHRRPNHYQVIPRTLIFVTRLNADSGRREVLLLKGAPTKRLWANRYNGLGGHVEANEDVLASAQRELAEESGLTGIALALRGVINVNSGSDAEGLRPGVMIFVFCGESAGHAADFPPAAEGMAEWLPVEALSDYPLVDDLYEVIPRALRGGPPFYGHYFPQEDGTMEYRFSP
jgi:8-oxo-dGTP diphosphatase